MNTSYQTDCYYQTAFEYFNSHQQMISAGWIDEVKNNNGSKVDPLLELITTPMGKLNISKDKKNKILVTTGSFGPFHEGHINMMNQARKKIESEGYHVAGGYVSPSHDTYVRTKNNMYLDIYDRIDIIEDILEKNDWLMLDKYEALYTPIPINFTTVIERLKDYLKFHLAIDVDIVYVFGGDNIEFARAFVSHGEFVCVLRDKSTLIDMSFMPSNERFRLINDEHAIVEKDSSSIRELFIENNLDDDIAPYYLLRDDSLQSSFFQISRDDVKNLSNIIKKYSNKKVLRMDVDEQATLANRVIDETDRVVSLDLYYQGNAQLDVCRLFDISETQTSPLELVFRTSSEDTFMLEGLGGSVVILDDDKASGKTMEMVKTLLASKDIVATKEVFLNTLFINNQGIKHKDIYDIVDVRDFLIGAKYGGLCVRLPDGSKARSPYIAPYVNLKTRAKIETKHHHEFSLEILNWNRKLFEKHDILLNDICELTQQLFDYIGFNKNTKMTEICDWHIEKLKGAI